MSTHINVLPITMDHLQIKELNKQAKIRNDIQLDNFCDKCKIGCGILLICGIFVYMICLLIVIRFTSDRNYNSHGINLKIDNNSGSH